MQPLAAGVQYRSTLFNSRYSRGLQYVLVVIPSCGVLDLLSPSASPGPIGPHYSMSGTVPVLKYLLAPAKKCWNIKNRSNPQTTSYIITETSWKPPSLRLLRQSLWGRWLLHLHFIFDMNVVRATNNILLGAIVIDRRTVVKGALVLHVHRC